MKKLIRIISGLLTALMLIGGLSYFSLIDVSATSTKKDEEPTTEELLKAYLTKKYDTPEAKFNAMTFKIQKDGYELRVNAMSGEVAVRDIASGQIIFTNPYDIASSNGSAQTKEQLMSQILVRYVDNDAEKTFYSFIEAGYRDQIKVKNIKNGIRVEYTLGREETRMLLPRHIRKERFEEVILSVAAEALGEENFTYKKLAAYYLLKDPNDVGSDRAREELYAAFPITKKMAIYVFDPTASETERRRIEEIIKTYCPLYTYEELDKDHEETEYEGADRAPALFKMALEYTLDTSGLSVRLPANGIRFDESEYQLSYISILPYMGAGANYAGSDTAKVQSGYTFFPDGSGSIFRFEKLASLPPTIIAGKVYGQDYAYQTVGGEHQEVIRYPAFGIVSNDLVTKQVKVEENGVSTYVNKEVEVDRGYLAIIEEGDAMAEIYVNHSASLSKYNYMEMRFYPRPKDTYNMSDALSVGQNATVTVVSTRKYVGNYKIRYIMLTDDTLAEEKNISKYYEASWIGMATAFREQLQARGLLQRLTEADVKKDIPLYLETFGTIETTKKILSVPVKTMVPLTSFADIMTMYDDLAEDGITNINFKLTGYANGGMFSGVPYKLDWESAVGGKSGFEDLVAYAKEKGFGVYPDFDFVYVVSDIAGGNLTDGLSFKNHLARTIDKRAAQRQEYSPVWQGHINWFGSINNIISAAYYSRFTEKLTKNYLKYDNGSISVSTLGSELSSDFDEDEPYNREDSKQYTKETFDYLDENYSSIMVSGGNAYSWKYVDHILGASLDSSRYVRSSNSVPFLGVVLHGAVSFAGTPLNMEGNIGYAMLRTIENGASPYFILSYQNTTLLKEDWYLSRYYSVRYDIWYNDLVKIYNELNGVLADVQTKLIVDHQFLSGERVPDADEIEADIREAMAAMEASLSKAEADAAVQGIKDILTARLTAKNNSATIKGLLETVKVAADDAKASIAAIETALLAIPAAEAARDAALAAEADALAVYTAAQAAKTEAYNAYLATPSSEAELKAAKKAEYDAALVAESNARTANTAAQAATAAAKKVIADAETALANALKAGTTAADTADSSAKTAASLAAAARAAAEFVSKINSATAEIKKAALDYAAEAERDAAETLAYAEKANENAAVAKAISADRTVASLISAAKTASDNATMRSADVIKSYNTLLTLKTAYDDAIAAEALVLKAYEEAEAVYETLLAAAALPTATEDDKNAATAAGSAMNDAKSAYSTAQTATSRAKSNYTSALTSVKNYLQRVLDAKNSALTAAESTAAALKSATEAVEALNTAEGISETLKNAAIASRNAATTAAASVTEYVEAAKATYAEAAELVKDYVVIVETPTDPGTPTTPTTPGTSGDTDDGDRSTKYTNDNGNIVKVTYGDPGDGGSYIAYKTFILNYNFFDVTVIVDGVKYTIPASGYVVFYH